MEKYTCRIISHTARPVNIGISITPGILEQVLKRALGLVHRRYRCLWTPLLVLHTLNKRFVHALSTLYVGAEQTNLASTFITVRTTAGLSSNHGPSYLGRARGTRLERGFNQASVPLALISDPPQSSPGPSSRNPRHVCSFLIPLGGGYD